MALVPARTVVGDTVRVAGTDLGTEQGTRNVLFASGGGGTVAAPVITWDADTVVVIVPTGAEDGMVTVDDGTSASNGLAFDTAPALVTWTEVQTLLNAGGCNGCHFGGGPVVGNFDTQDYAHITSGTSNHGPVILPRRGEESILVKKLRGTAGFGDPMPQFAPSRPEAEIQKYVDWIDQGARNN